MSEFIENISAVRQSAREDLKNSSAGQTLGFLATAATLTAHESVMIEALYAVGSHALSYSGNPLVVGAAMGGFSLAVETGLSVGVSHSIETFGNATKTIKERYFSAAVDAKAPEQKGNKLLSAFDTVLFAATLGSPGIILREYSRHPDKTLAENKKTGLKAATALAAVNAVIGVSIAGGAALTEKLGSDVVTNTIIDLGNNPYFYASTFSVIALRGAIANRSRRRKLKAKDTL